MQDSSKGSRANTFFPIVLVFAFLEPESTKVNKEGKICRDAYITTEVSHCVRNVTFYLNGFRR